MNKSTITRERIEQYANDPYMCINDEIRELARIALAAMDSEPVAFTEEHEISNMHATGLYLRAWPADRARNAVEGYTIPLYRHAQQPVVDADDNFYSWFGREWQENYQHNQYTTAAKQMLGVMAESAWKAGHRAAMLQAAPVCTCPSGDGSLRWPCPVHPGNSPIIPEGLIAAVNRLLDSDGSRGCYSAIRCGNARFEVERLLAAAPQEVPDGK